MLDKSKNALLNLDCFVQTLLTVLNFVLDTFKAALNVSSGYKWFQAGYVMFKAAYGNWFSFPVLHCLRQGEMLVHVTDCHEVAFHAASWMG